MEHGAWGMEEKGDPPSLKVRQVKKGESIRPGQNRNFNTLFSF